MLKGLRNLCSKLLALVGFRKKLLINSKTANIAKKYKTTLGPLGKADMDISLKMSEAFNAGWFPEHDTEDEEERDIVLKASTRQSKLVHKSRVWYARSTR